MRIGTSATRPSHVAVPSIPVRSTRVALGSSTTRTRAPVRWSVTFEESASAPRDSRGSFDFGRASRSGNSSEPSARRWTRRSRPSRSTSPGRQRPRITRARWTSSRASATLSQGSSGADRSATVRPRTRRLPSGPSRIDSMATLRPVASSSSRAIRARAQPVGATSRTTVQKIVGRPATAATRRMWIFVCRRQADGDTDRRPRGLPRAIRRGLRARGGPGRVGSIVGRIPNRRLKIGQPQSE